ncbi:MAG: DNA translocase FtsK [Clostridium sp.]|nr:DNA translocase FtsK [Clostridium sp.]MCM1444405.1 DNA translocase FtsK [Candidatus Amulumruptor caecigallinarius]
MPKKKKRKDENKTSKGYKVEVIGILLILLGIIGICKFGPVGIFISGFAGFFVGTANNILLAALFVVGGYIIVKREEPVFFTSKLVGLYVMVISFLILMHMSYIKQLNIEVSNILGSTLDNLLAYIQGAQVLQGGGMIGALFGTLFVKMFTIEGTNIVCIALIICGLIMFTGLSIYDVISSSKKKIKNIVNHDKLNKEKKEISKIANEYENDNKVIISSVDELIHQSDEQKEQEKEENKEEVVYKTEEEYIENTGYKCPPISILTAPGKKERTITKEEITKTAETLKNVFKDFNIEGHVVAVNVGPAVTQYEMEIKAGTKVSKILSLNREIALSLAAKDVRIQAPIPGKSTIGIEIPNKSISMVTVREIIEAIPSNMCESKLAVTLGKNIMGKPIYCEINKTPHLLVAGSTGSGKSVCINSIIVSILMRSKPDEVKFVLVDPKKVELSMYNGVPHLLTPVVTDARKANIALKKIVVEMEKRYDMFEASGTKNIAGYNAYIDKKNENLSDNEKTKKLPFIVVIIDELADLMLVAAKEVEDSIMRITQMARAAGIHLIVATQRPSTDVITGVVKANIPSRISFAVSSSIDSRTILDMTGAEKLLGKGDMLFLPQGENTPIRVQGTFISDDDIKKVVDYTIAQQKARYDETFLMDDEEMNATTMVDDDSKSADAEEPLYNEIVEFVVTQGKASASLLQRRFRLGYNRAARCIDLLEERGIVGPQNGSKPREVLVKLDKED